MADADMSGTVTFQEFLDVVEMLHPYNFVQAKRLLDQLDLNERRGISFDLFLEIHQRYEYSGTLQCQSTLIFLLGLTHWLTV